MLKEPSATPVMEERLARLEGIVDQFPQMVAMLQNGIDALRSDHVSLRGGMAAIRGEMSALRNEVHERMNRLDGRIDRLEDRMARQFVWLVGLQVTTLVAVLGAVLARG